MNGVIGMTSLLQDTDARRAQREYTETIRQSGQNLLVIINDILDFSKVESGTVTLERRPFDLREAVTRAVWTCWRRRHAPKGIALESTIDARCARSGSSATPSGCARLPINLIGEWREVHRARIRSEVSVRRTSAADGAPGSSAMTLEFCVNDSGIGIPRRAAGHSCSGPSRRSTAARAPATAAPDWGWRSARAWSRRWVARFGCTSEAGAGASFYFTMPTVAAPGAAEPAKAPAIRGIRRSRWPQRLPLRILVAEDNERQPARWCW